MNTRDFERRISLQLPYSASDIDQRTRRLRELSLLPDGGRGRHAPDINACDAALLFLALLADEAADAGKVACLAGALRLVEPTLIKDPFGRRPRPSSLTLVWALTFLLQELEFDWRHLLIASDGRWATLTITRDGHPFDLEFAPRPEVLGAYDSRGSWRSGRSVDFKALFMKNFALNGLRGIKSGWVGEEGSPSTRALADALGAAERVPVRLAEILATA